MCQTEGPAEVSHQFEQLTLEPASIKLEPDTPIPGERRHGTVRWFNASKGFGFIQPDGAEGDTEDLFVHQVRTNTLLYRYRSIRAMWVSVSSGLDPAKYKFYFTRTPPCLRVGAGLQNLPINQIITSPGIAATLNAAPDPTAHVMAGT